MNITTGKLDRLFVVHVRQISLAEVGCEGGASFEMSELFDHEQIDLAKLTVERDFDLRKQEVELRRRELDLKESEQLSSKWKSPLVIGIFVAALGVIGNIAATSLQGRANQKLAHERAQADLIIEAVRTGDPIKADANLRFFINAHLVDDPTGEIEKAIDTGSAPVLPAAMIEKAAQRAWLPTDGQPANYTEALRDFILAADKGSARAMANVGWIYENGLGVEQDYRQAMIWYRKAAEGGDIIANWNIGRLYEFGWGVPRNLDSARSWYGKGAALGYGRASLAAQNVGRNDPNTM